jgi:single-stranded-DNA-specific exonuclease
MNLHFIQTDGSTTEDYLMAVAKNVGCTTIEEIQMFLNPQPPIINPIDIYPDYATARDRLILAIEKNERISIYGDYDCDGITSIVQLIHLLSAAGHTNYSWFIPDRMEDSYGLTLSGLEKCVKQYNPQLIISVDCGSNSINEIKWLRERNIDCIVLDHHEIFSSNEKHPAIAHLNPKCFEPRNEDLASMCASGFVFLFCCGCHAFVGFEPCFSKTLIIVGQ